MKFSSLKHRRFIQTRSAYTLLELLLSLALTVAVISTIATAIHVNLFSLTRAQATIERKQIARSVLAMIGSDIRAAVQFRAADYSGLEEVLLSQQLIAGVQPTDLASGAADEITADNISVDAIEAAVEAQTAPQSAAEGFTSGEVDSEEESDDWSVGLVGDANYIWLDISRLPRIDQYHPLIQTAQDAVTTGSDIKQVVYYVASASAQNSSNDFFADESGANQQGLFRDEIDRAVAFYQGGFAPGTPQDYSQLIATEVVQIQFRYFDGTDWQSQWDSVENEGFPAAVEVSIVVDTNPQAGQAASNLQNEGRFERYRSVVHLPLAEIQPEDEDEF
jgi:hypothetical protein